MEKRDRRQKRDKVLSSKSDLHLNQVYNVLGIRRKSAVRKSNGKDRARCARNFSPRLQLFYMHRISMRLRFSRSSNFHR